jgi:hypothetical protein
MQSLDRHNASKKHKTRSSPSVNKYTCECGKYYLHRQSLNTHKLSCVAKVPPAENGVTSNQEILHQLQIYEMKQAFEKERHEMMIAFNQILEKHAGTGTTNNTTNNNNIETQNINIIINAFGNENTDYIDDKAILACIGRVYKSIPSLLEKIHFDPKHPENHNIKITNKKLPYASVMGNNQKWKTVDRKDAIETMVLNGYNLLDEKYTENKDKISTSKQLNFEGFQSKFESEEKEIMKQIKTDVDTMVLNGV